VKVIKKILASRIFRIFLSGGLLFLAFRKVNILALIGDLAKVDWWFIAIQMVLFIMLMVLGAWRWVGLILKKFGFRDLVNFLKSAYLGVFYGIFLPTASAGDALKWPILLKKYPDISKTKLFGSVIIDKMVGFFTFIAVALVASILGWILGLNFPNYLRLMFGGMLLGVIIFYVLAIKIPTGKWLGRFKWLDKVVEMAEFFKDIGLRRMGKSLLISIVCEIIWIGQIYLSSIYFGANFGLIRAFAYLPAIYLILVLPISVAGFGAREHLYLLFFGGLASEEKILLVSTFTGLVGIVNALLGGLVLVLK
jgi:glycosyltransferase 2 family protein